MPVKIEYVDAPGVKTNIEIGNAEIFQLKSKKEFSSDHYLELEVYRTSLGVGCGLSSKLLPIVVAMWERDGRNYWSDFYSFDHKGVLLSHGYSRGGGDLEEIKEAHDLSLERLIEHGETIKEMIGDYPLPSVLVTRIVMDLKTNKVG